MRLLNCKLCGKLFSSVGTAVCSDCLKKEADDFEKVRTYLKEHPNATVIQVSRETGVSTRKIFAYVREGRLVLKHASGEDGITCMGCGKPIQSGRFCAQCAEEMQAALRAALPEAKRSEPERKRDNIMAGGRIHTLDLRRRRR